MRKAGRERGREGGGGGQIEGEGEEGSAGERGEVRGGGRFCGSELASVQVTESQ